MQSSPTAYARWSQQTIEFYLPAKQFEVLKAAEESERRLISDFVKGLNGSSRVRHPP
jgi:hypothetical protein